MVRKYILTLQKIVHTPRKLLLNNYLDIWRSNNRASTSAHDQID